MIANCLFHGFEVSRVDTDVELEVAYSCNIFDVSDSLTCPDIQSS